jgi:acetyl esterase
MAQVDPQVRALLDRWAAGTSTPVSALTAEEVREDDLAVLALQRPPAALHSVEDLEAPGPDGPVPVRVYRPREGPLHPVLFFHGGGFVIGRKGYDAPLRDLAHASDCLLVAPEPRLAPEHPFPAAARDALAAARWLPTAAPALGASDAAPGVGGDSSGGNLAAGVTQQLVREGTPPAFQVLVYPMLDATASAASYAEFATGFGFSAEKSRWYFDRYLPPGIDRRDSRVSPLFSRDLAGLPPTLIATAECDPLRDEGERYGQRLREAGVAAEVRRYPGMIHGFFQMTGALAGARELHADLAAWMRARARAG